MLVLLLFLISRSSGSEFLLGAGFLTWGKAPACLMKLTSCSTWQGNQIRPPGFWLTCFRGLLSRPYPRLTPRALPAVGLVPWKYVACSRRGSSLVQGSPRVGPSCILDGLGTLVRAGFHVALLLTASARCGCSAQPPAASSELGGSRQDLSGVLPSLLRRLARGVALPGAGAAHVSKRALAAHRGGAFLSASCSVSSTHINPCWLPNSGSITRWASADYG